MCDRGRSSSSHGNHRTAPQTYSGLASWGPGCPGWHWGTQPLLATTWEERKEEQGGEGEEEKRREEKKEKMEKKRGKRKGKRSQNSQARGGKETDVCVIACESSEEPCVQAPPKLFSYQPKAREELRLAFHYQVM